MTRTAVVGVEGGLYAEVGSRFKKKDTFNHTPVILFNICGAHWLVVLDTYWAMPKSYGFRVVIRYIGVTIRVKVRVLSCCR